MTTSGDMTSAPASALVRALRAREISSRELLDAYLDRIEQVNPAINAVVTIDAEAARAAATAADEQIARGQELGALHGLPMTVKDALETAGMRTTSGFPDLAEYVPARDADAVARLRGQGAVIFGKTNLPTFAMDWQTYNPIFGTTNNPWDLTRTPGGSSGGPAAAVAAGMTALDMGSDLSGSLRQPAHTTGVFTLKPSFGVVPGRGHIPGPPGTLSNTDMAVLGPIGRTADDLDLALDVLAGPDEWSATAWQLRLPPARGRSLSEYRVGVWLDDSTCPVDSEVLGVLEAAVTQLASAGARIDIAARPVDLADSNALFVNLLMAAVSPGTPDWNQTNERRQQLRARWQAFFRSFDVLLTPVSPVAAIAHDHTGDVFSRTITVNGSARPYVEQGVWTGLARVAYLPAAVAPFGRTTGGLPVGVQVIAPYLEDRTAIDVARHIERHLGGFVAPPTARSGCR